MTIFACTKQYTNEIQDHGFVILYKNDDNFNTTLLSSSTSYSSFYPHLSTSIFVIVNHEPCFIKCLSIQLFPTLHAIGEILEARTRI